MRLAALAFIAVLLAGAVRAQAAPLERGAYAVGERVLAAEAAAPITLWYPAVPGSPRLDALPTHGRFPLVLCAPLEPMRIAPLAEHLASYGFVVAAPATGGDLADAKARLLADGHVDPARIALLGVGAGVAEALPLAARDPQVRAVVSLDGEAAPSATLHAVIGHFYASDGPGADLAWLQATTHAERLVAPYHSFERLAGGVLTFLREALYGVPKTTPDDAFRLPAVP